MKPTILAISVLLVLASQRSSAQDVPSDPNDHARSLIKAHFGRNYELCAVFGVDDALLNPPEEPSFLGGYILEDSTHQLRHCLIVTYARWATGDASGYGLDTRGSLAIIRNDSVIWHSAALLYNGCGANVRISGFCDLNNDGVTDILMSVASGGHGEIEDLWIMSPDSRDGRLLNAIDENERSTIVGAFDSYRITRADKQGLRSIQALDIDSESLTVIKYAWNGKHFVRWR